MFLREQNLINFCWEYSLKENDVSLQHCVHFNNFSSFMQECVINEAWKAINRTIHTEQFVIIYAFKRNNESDLVFQ